MEALADEVSEYSWSSNYHWGGSLPEVPEFQLIHPLSAQLSTKAFPSRNSYANDEGHTVRVTVRFVKPVKRGTVVQIVVRRVDRSDKALPMDGLHVRRISPEWPLERAEISLVFSDDVKPRSVYTFSNTPIDQPIAEADIGEVVEEDYDGTYSAKWAKLRVGRTYGMAWMF